MKESCWSSSLRVEGAGESCTSSSSHLILASQSFRGKVFDYSRMQKGSAPAGPPAASPGVGSISAPQPGLGWEQHLHTLPLLPRELGGPGVTPLSPRRTGRPSGVCGSGNKGSWQGTAPPDANLPLASHPLCVSLKIPRRRKFVPRGGCSPPREGLPALPRHENSPQPRSSTAPARPGRLEPGDASSAPCPAPQPTHGSRHSPRAHERELFASKPASRSTARMDAGPRGSPCQAPHGFLHLTPHPPYPGEMSRPERGVFPAGFGSDPFQHLL